MAAKPSFYITTAISYPNGEPHIGHAYEAIATDAIARFKRLDGFDVHFLTGVDEHGLKMKQTATTLGMTPMDLAERNSARFKAMTKALNISNDDFIRTTEQRHYAASQEMWKRMTAAGDIYLSGYAGWYSVRDEAFYAEDETTVREDGVRVGPQGTPVEWTQEQTYFFRLSKYQDKLLAHYEANPDFILPPERRNEVVSFVKGGLQDLSISRTTFDWGIPVPDAPGHIMYVWVDALTNYITGVGFPDAESESFKKYWPADIHMIGKDITRFHAVYWPAFLMSAGLPVPKRVFSHGFLLHRGEKIGKSAGNASDLFSMVENYGVDALRYFFLREVSFGQDGNYNHEAIVNRTNADLANNIGNLASRSLSIATKNCGGLIPEPGAFTEAEEKLLAAADGLIGLAREAMERQALHRVLEAVAGVSSDTNGYFADAAPWALKKTDPARMATVLYVTAEVLRQVGILMQPFIPVTADKLLTQLGLGAEMRGFDRLGKAGRLTPGMPLGALGPIFPRYVEPEGSATAQ